MDQKPRPPIVDFSKMTSKTPSSQADIALLMKRLNKVEQGVNNLLSLLLAMSAASNNNPKEV